MKRSGPNLRHFQPPALICLIRTDNRPSRCAADQLGLRLGRPIHTLKPQLGKLRIPGGRGTRGSVNSNKGIQLFPPDAQEGPTLSLQVRVFDLERIFIGNLPWTFTLEIVFRTTFMYIFTLIVIRVIGKRGLRELTLFEFVIIFALGSAVGDPMFYPEIPLLHGMAVVTTFVAIHRALALLTTTIPGLQQLVYPGKTACLVRDGVIIQEAMKKERLAEKDLFMILRETGIEHLGQVKRAYLEPTGEISVWQFKESETKPGRPLTPDCDLGEA